MASVGLSRSARLTRLAIHSRIILPTKPYTRSVSQCRRHLSVGISVIRPRLQQRENEASSAIAIGYCRAGSHTMQSYLFIGGYQDGLSFPLADDADFVQWPDCVTDSETYARQSLNAGGAVIDILPPEKLTPATALAP